MQHELSYFTRPDNVNIAWSQAGTGPPLVLVPGWTTHLRYFWSDPSTHLFGPMTEHQTLITYDKHGCGLSDRDRTEFTLEAERYEVEALVDYLELERFNLMGMSEGGTVAADYAANRPERVERLVLYSTTANGAGLAPEDFRKSFVDIVRASVGRRVKGPDRHAHTRCQQRTTGRVRPVAARKCNGRSRGLDAGDALWLGYSA